jgi:porin
MSRKYRVIALLALLMTVSLVAASDADPSSVDGEEELLEGPFEGVVPTDTGYEAPGISGDWGGARSWLSEKGVEFSWDLTQSYQGVMDGGFHEDAEYLGSSEMILDLDTEKLGLWPGGFARVAAEGRFGDDTISDAGTFSPVNNDALFPADPDRAGKDVFALTEMTATQFLASWIGFYGGLLNTTSGDANEYAGFLRSNEHFQNLSLGVSAVSLRVVPSVTLGGGLVLIPFEWLTASFTFMNTEESAGSNPFDTDGGVTFVTEWQLEHDVFDLPARHVASFALGFENDFFRLGKLPQFEAPPGLGPTLRFATKDESWALWYNGQLDVWKHVEDTERRAGIFLRFGYADDKTSFVEWNLAAGIGGVGVFDLRPRDRFGIGIYHLEPSDEFPLPDLGIEDETGFEVFYNVEIWRGFNLTADLQYIESSLGGGRLVTEEPDDAWVGGLRLRIVL